MTTPRPVRTAPRRALLAQVQRRFIARGYPRILTLTILGVAGVASFAFSAILLRLGFEHMGLRYLLATLAGYATFLLLIRLWIAFHRREWDPSFDVPDAASGSAGADHGAFGGGESGGAGASGSWDGPGIDGSLPSVDVDVDDAWPVVLAAVIALGGLLALIYVVYAAPVLLAEVALDAALVTGIYRKLRRADARHWLTSTVRRTWAAAVIVAVSVGLAGTVMQWVVPTARSIGDILAQLNR